jgi:ElaB/YqjD/DUF883 family membrane-anchored ribosome-binding protein
MSTYRDDPEQLERNSDAIRADMSATLNKLGRKLAPGELIDRSATYLRDNGGDFVTQLSRQIKENPIPVTLTAIGLAWLVASQSRSRPRATSGDERASSGYRDNDLLPEDYASPGITPEPSDEVLAASSGNGSGAKVRIKHAGQHLKARASHMRDRVRAATQSSRGGAVHAKDSLQQFAENQPLALGAIGVAVGAIIGSALPSTRREDELFGRAREHALDRARELGSEKYTALRERAVSAAERAKEAAKEALRGDGADDRNAMGTHVRDEGAFHGSSTPAGRA